MAAAPTDDAFTYRIKGKEANELNIKRLAEGKLILPAHKLKQAIDDHGPEFLARDFTVHLKATTNIKGSPTCLFITTDEDIVPGSPYRSIHILYKIDADKAFRRIDVASLTCPENDEDEDMHEDEDDEDMDTRIPLIKSFFFNFLVEKHGPWILHALTNQLRTEFPERTTPGIIMQLLMHDEPLQVGTTAPEPQFDVWRSLKYSDNQGNPITSKDIQIAAQALITADKGINSDQYTTLMLSNHLIMALDTETLRALLKKRNIHIEGTKDELQHTLKIAAAHSHNAKQFGAQPQAVAFLRQKFNQNKTIKHFARTETDFLTNIAQHGYYGLWNYHGAFKNIRATFTDLC